MSDTPVYADLATLKAAMSITSDIFDDDLTQKIAAASRAIDEACNRRFYPDDDAQQVRRFLPENPGYCMLDDLIELTSVTAQDSVWVRDSDFYLEPINANADGRPYTGLRTIARPFIFTKSQIPAGWAGFDGRITVTGKWGWAQVPDAITTATEILARRLFTRTHDAPLGILQMGTGLEAVRMARNDPDIGDLIGPYALVVLF